MDWLFPPLLWKQIMGEPVDLHDLTDLDFMCAQSINEIDKLGKKYAYTPDEFDKHISGLENKLYFSTFLSNGTVVDLKTGGSNILLCHENYEEWVELMTKTRLDESKKQLEWLQEGINYVVDISIFSLLTYYEIEIRACGPKDISRAALEAVTEYSGFDKSHRMAKMFWKMFESFTQN